VSSNISAFFAFYEILGSSSMDLFSVLGHGKKIFDFVVGVQFFGIYLFMPAISCGVLTAEKERNSLGLLFLTRLGPTAILFEKLLSRMIPMLTFLLLSLPLLAFAYSLGGITKAYLWSGVWVLALTMLQMCSLAVMCSAFFRRTVGAFIGAYLIGLIVLFALPVAEEFGLFNFRSSASAMMFYGEERSESALVAVLQAVGIIGDGWQDTTFAFNGWYVFYQYAGRNVTFSTIVLRSIPMMFSCVCFLVLARLFVVRRAFVPARNYLMGLFRSLDGLFVRMNENSVTKGIVLIRETTALPDDAPVAWRETTKKSMGTARYLFRIFVATEIPIVVGCILTIGFSYDSSRLVGISMMLFLLWFIAVLLVSVKATSLVSAERSHQTLDVLLTTPLSARDIVMQKFRGVRRLMFVLAVPFMTIFLFEASWRSEFTGGYGYRREFSLLLYLTASILSIVIYLPMIAWMSFLVGMLLRTQGKAIIASLGIIIFWCVAPVCFLVFIDEVLFRGFMRNDAFQFLMLFSPLTIIPINEFNEYQSIGDMPWTAVIVNFVAYGICLFSFRFACLHLANRLLGRGED
jgi:ABC-type transport system involved in multi-copper enzyme maturation permease subunit